MAAKNIEKFIAEAPAERKANRANQEAAPITAANLCSLLALAHRRAGAVGLIGRLAIAARE
jgi:hypothetical protein